jgi:hypothetical protein
MSALDEVTETQLAVVVPDQIMARARSYLNRVLNPVRSGDTLSAQVRGSWVYRVELTVDGERIQGTCSCPYARRGLCKHATALLLKWIRHPDSFVIIDESRITAGDAVIETVDVDPPLARQPEEPPAWVSASFEARQRQDLDQLEQWLEAVRLQDLRALARERGWKVKGTRKTEVAEQVAGQIIDPAGIQEAIAGLDREHLAVLRGMVLLGDDPRVSTEAMERVARIWSPLRSYKQIGTYTQHLWRLGLALPGGVRNDYPPDSDFVPPALSRMFPPLLADAVSALEALPAGVPASDLRLAEPLNLVRAAGQIAILLEQMPVPLRPPMPRPRLEARHADLRGWDYDPVELALAAESRKLQRHMDLALTVPPPGRVLPDEAIERLAPVAGDETRLDFVYALLVAAGLFYPGSPTTVWPEVKVEYLRRGEAAQRGILGRAYLHLTEWSELWEVLRRDERLKLKRNWRYAYVKPEHLKAALLRLRRLVLRVLASLPEDQWLALADILAMMRVVWPRFESGRALGHSSSSGTGPWYLTGDGEPLQFDNAADWDRAQGRFIREAIAGPLHWLGFADLQLEGEELVAFRLHGLADLVWDRTEIPAMPRHAAGPGREATPAEAMAVDELSVRVDPSAVSAQAHNLLDQIGRLEVVEADRFVYRLDVRAAYQAFERGASLPDLLEEWQDLLPVEPSEPIRAKLEAWWAAYGRVRIYENLTIVEFGDEFALAEMKGTTSLEQYLVAEISSRVVIVRPEGVDTLVAQLERAGYTPKQTRRV